MSNFTPGMSEKLVQYLDGELGKEEQDLLEKQLAADTAAMQEYESLLAARTAVRYYGLQQQVVAVHRQMIQEKMAPVKKMNTGRRIIRYSIAIAAGLLLVVGSYLAYRFYTLSSEKVFASNYQTYELSIMRGDSMQVATQIEKAYEARKYAAVTTISYDRPFTIKEHFLRALSFTEINNPALAIDGYKKVLELNEAAKTVVYKEDAEYFLSLSYIRNGDFDYALELLNKIKENPDHLYHNRVTHKLTRQVKLLKWR